MDKIIEKWDEILNTVKKEYEALIDGILPKLGIPEEGQCLLLGISGISPRAQ